MAQEPALLKVTRQAGTVQVEFTTRKILDEANIAEIGERLSEIVEKEERPRLIISFSAVDHLSSAALGTLIAILSPTLPLIYSITKLDKLFRIYSTVKEAQESLQPAPAG